MRTRTRYIPIFEAEPGMVLGESLMVSVRGIVRLSIAAGHVLTEDLLQQLLAHRTEFIYIAESDDRSDEQVAVDAAMSARRTMEIFDGADLSNPTMTTLFNQVLVYRSS